MKARSHPSLAEAIRGLHSRSRSRGARPPLPVPIWIAYGDIRSARRALARVTNLMRAQQPHAEVRPMLWRFNQLDDPRWREMALRDAARAHVVVLAMENEDAFCARTEEWMNGLLRHVRRASLDVLALVGEDDAWTIKLGPLRTAESADEETQSRGREVFGSVARKAVAAFAA